MLHCGPVPRVGFHAGPQVCVLAVIWHSRRDEVALVQNGREAVTSGYFPRPSGGFVISQLFSPSIVVPSSIYVPAELPSETAPVVSFCTPRVVLDGGVEVGNREIEFPAEETSFRSLAIGDLISSINVQCSV